jgi:hypothetical protein
VKAILWGTIEAALLPLCWISSAQTNLLSESNQRGPTIALSPSVLDFGLVAVGKTTNLALTLQNAGEAILTGTVTVAAPFSVDPHTYSLGSGASQSLTVRYQPTAQETNTQWVVFTGASTATVAVTGYARQRPQPPKNLKVKPPVFASEAQADFVVRYYSDATSYVMKPLMIDGKAMGTRGEVEFLKPCSRADVLQAAAGQGRRELAVVVLVSYPGGAMIELPVKQNWDRELKALGYQRIVFLRGATKTTRINGLRILEGP